MVGRGWRARPGRFPRAGASLGRLDRLVLEVPGLRFPFDLSQGSGGFAQRRCRLIEFGFSLAAEELQGLLSRCALDRFGLFAPELLWTAQGLRLGLGIKVAGREADLTAKVTVVPRPAGWWRVTLQDARVHGFVPVPAPLLLDRAAGRAGPCRAGGQRAPRLRAGHWAIRAPALLRARGLTEADIDASELVLVSVLASAGWRLPARDGLESRPVDLAAGRLGFALAPPSLAVARDDGDQLAEPGQPEVFAALGAGLGRAGRGHAVDR